MSTTLFVPNNSSSHLPYRSTSGLNVCKFYQESGGIKIMNKILAAPLWLIILARFVGAQSLDYQTYKTTVEPIFLEKRLWRRTSAQFPACSHPRIAWKRRRRTRGDLVRAIGGFVHYLRCEQGSVVAVHRNLRFAGASPRSCRLF